MFDNFVADNMISTTWANLVELRDNDELKPGSFYRITDYNFYTDLYGIQSGNHQFDIIVLAISENMLSESAYAARHSGDTYFTREVPGDGIEWLYTIYVDDYAADYGDDPVNHTDDVHSLDVFCDSDVLEHPETGEEVPVLYKTDTGEYDLDDPDYGDTFFYEGTYEIDGVDYDMWSKYEQIEGELEFVQTYALTPVVVQNGVLTVPPTGSTKTIPLSLSAWEIKYHLDNDKTLFNWASSNGKGVIYYMKDEFGNEAEYDFKNVKFERKIVSSVDKTVLSSLVGTHTWINDSSYAIHPGNTSKYFYTFFKEDGGTIIDSSLNGECSNNIIKACHKTLNDNSVVRILNNIIIQQGESNFFDAECFDITLTNFNESNHFGMRCSNIIFQGGGYNTITDRGRALIIISSSQNTFGTACYEIILKSSEANVFEGVCRDIVLTNGDMGNVFGRGCSNITLGGYNYNNNFLENCNAISLQSYCNENSFGRDVSNTNINVSFTKYCTIGNNVKNVNLNGSSGGSNNYMQYITIGNNVQNMSFAPQRNAQYEQIWYRSGRVENAI